jgi:hypothetical protein
VIKTVNYIPTAGHKKGAIVAVCVEWEKDGEKKDVCLVNTQYMIDICINNACRTFMRKDFGKKDANETEAIEIIKSLKEEFTLEEFPSDEFHKAFDNMQRVTPTDYN